MIKRKKFLLLFALLSGFAALIYELIWFRQLHIVFGVSSYALATVVTTFLLGLVLGSYFSGKFVERYTSLSKVIKAYAVVEICIALFALLVPVFIKLVTPLLKLVYNVEPGLYTLNLIRFVLTAIVLIIPSICIGATFPLLIRLYTESRGEIKEGISLLYSINTFGGVLGVVVAGFFLIKAFGMNATLWIAICCNVLVAIMALMLSKNYKESNIKEENLILTETKKNKRFILWLLFFSGFLALAYEVVWGRLLALYFFGTIYATSMLLAVFLLGIAIGSLVYNRFFKQASLKKFIYLQMIAALFAMISFGIYVFFPKLNVLLGFGTSILTLFIFSCIMMLIPTICFGIIFPLLADYNMQRSKKIGLMSGKVYAINTLGAIIGSFIAGFVLIPLFGLKSSLITLAIIGLIIVLYVFVKRKITTLKVLIPFGCIILIIIGIMLFVPAEFTIGVLNKDTTIAHYDHGLSATVSVLEKKQEGALFRELRVDNQEVAADTPVLTLDSKILGHLPLLLHNNPKNALTVGFGTGGTSYSMLTHDLDEVDALEIEQKVVDTHEYFKSLNKDVIKNEKLNIIIDDARSYLLLTDKKYDVISTDVTNLRYYSNANLYTKEYFEILKSKLNKGGVVSAWVPSSDINEEDQKILMKTFKSVFPHMTVWYMYHKLTHFLIYIGTEEPLSIDYPSFITSFNRDVVKQDLEEVDVTPYNLLNALFMDSKAIEMYVKGSKLHTDNHPVLEFPDVVITNESFTFGKNMRAVYEQKVDPLPFVKGFENTHQRKEFIDKLRYEQENVTVYLIAGHTAVLMEDPQMALIAYGEAINRAEYLNEVDL